MERTTNLFEFDTTGEETLFEKLLDRRHYEFIVLFDKELMMVGFLSGTEFQKRLGF